MNLPEDMQGAVLPENLPIEDKWILSLYNDPIKNVTSNLDSYELGVAGTESVRLYLGCLLRLVYRAYEAPVSQRAEKSSPCR